MMLPVRPGWLPPSEQLRRFFGNSALYPYYRVQLIDYIGRLLPEGDCSVVDVGAGDGSLAALLQKFRPGTAVVGLEVAIRKATRAGVPMVAFDGVRIPLRTRSTDVALLSNVLHHAEDPAELLQEVRRITRRRIIVKDHLTRGRIDDLKLAALDMMGNLRLGAQVSATYFSATRWKELISALEGATVSTFANLSFRRGLMRLAFSDSLEIMFAIDLAD